MLLAVSLDDILQCVYEKARMRVRSVVCKVVEQILLDLSRRELMDDILDTHIANYIDTSNVA